MDAAILLVLLTLNPAGQPGVNFVATDDMDTCEGKTILLKNILSSGGIKILENRCIPSNLKFTKYNHRPASDKAAKPVKRHAYQVSLGGEDISVMPMTSLEACEKDRNANPPAPGRKTYCATSVQAMK